MQVFDLEPDRLEHPKPITSGDVIERMFACQHRLVVEMTRDGYFHEWSPLEVLAMRVFARNTTSLSAADLERILGCSLAHASRLSRRLQKRGLIFVDRWGSFRSLSATVAGEDWLATELPYFTAFADSMLARLSIPERRELYAHLGQVMRTFAGS